MTVATTKSTNEHDSEKKEHELPPTGNRQRQDRDGFGTLKDAGTDSSSRLQRDYSPDPAQATLPVHLHLYRSKVKPAELILFTTQLSVMLDSGVVLSDALDAIADQAEYGTFKMVIMDIAETVKNGDDF